MRTLKSRTLSFLTILLLTLLFHTSSSIAQSYKLKVLLNRSELSVGELLNVTAKVYAEGVPVKGVLVELEIRDPEGKPRHISVNQTNDKGIAIFVVRISLNWPKGKYTVYVAISRTSIKRVIAIRVIKKKQFVHLKCLTTEGHPLPRATVMLFDTYGKRIVYTHTNTNGTSILFIYPGAYILKIIWKGVYVYDECVEVKGKELLILCEIYDLTIIVKEKYTGRLIANFEVTVKSLATALEKKYYTNSSGIALVKYLTKGLYEIRYDNKKLVMNVTRSETILIEVEPSIVWIIPQLLVLMISFIIYVIKEIITERRKRKTRHQRGSEHSSSNSEEV